MQRCGNEFKTSGSFQKMLIEPQKAFDHMQMQKILYTLVFLMREQVVKSEQGY